MLTAAFSVLELTSVLQCIVRPAVFAIQVSWISLVRACLQVWDLEAAIQAAPGSKPAELQASAAVAAHDKDINAVAVSPKDALVCSASQDRTARVRLVSILRDCTAVRRECLSLCSQWLRPEA